MMDPTTQSNDEQPPVEPQPQQVVQVSAVPPAVAPNTYNQPQTVIMSPQPVVAMATPAKKSKLWLWIVIGLVILAILGVGVLLALKFLVSKVDSDEVSDIYNSSQVADDNMSVDYPLTTDINATTETAWLFPITMSGWEPTVLDQSGINQLAKQNSESRFTSYQLYRDGIIATDDEAASAEYIDTFITTLKKSAYISDEQSSTLTFETMAGKSIEFAVLDYSYATASGTYRAKLVVRTTDKYIFSLLYAGLESDVSDAEWQQLTKNVQISSISN